MNTFLLLLAFLTGAGAAWLLFRRRIREMTDSWKRRLDALGSIPGTTKNQALPFSVEAALEEAIKRIREQAMHPLPMSVADTTADDLKKKIDTLYIVNDLGRKLTSSLHLEQTFHHLHTTLNSMMDAAITELCVYDEAGGKEMLTSLGDGTPYENPFSDWCYTNNREIILTHAARDYGRYVFRPLSLPGPDVQSVLCFPVISGNRIAGTLCIMSFREESFDDFHAEMVKLLLGYVAVALDNAMRHDELNRTRIRAEQSEKFKEQFLANMSHEIRTPIHAITGMTRLLLEKEPRPGQVRYLESIRNASDTLLVIVNDILDLSKIEAGKLELEHLDFSLHHLVANVADMLRHRADEKKLIFECSADERIPPVLVGDAVRLSQVLINLVGNAIKFTPSGSVTLRAVPMREQKKITTGEPYSVRLEVSDTGIGMTAEQQSRLFGNYEQASPDTARKYGGTGLGLSISRHLVKLMGGNLEVVSAAGKGSTFACTIALPVSARKAMPVSGAAPDPELLRGLSGLRVLLADDNEYNRIVVRETLELRIPGVVVDEAPDANKALELLRGNAYNVILLDLVMPDLNGYEVTRIIRREYPPEVASIPIVALTASVVKSEIERCAEAGMNGFIPKPFRESELFESIHKAVNGYTMTKAFSIKTPGPARTIKNIDLDYLIEFTEGDVVRRKRHVDLFLETMPQKLHDLEAATVEKNYDQVRVTAHAMKSQLRMMGASKCLELAEHMEQCCLTSSSLEDIPGMFASLEKCYHLAANELREASQAR